MHSLWLCAYTLPPSVAPHCRVYHVSLLLCKVSVFSGVLISAPIWPASSRCVGPPVSAELWGHAQTCLGLYESGALSS